MNFLMKGIMAAALVVGGSTALTAPAAAQTSFGVWVGSGPGYGYRYRDYPRHGYRHYRHWNDRRWGYRSGWDRGWRGYDRRRCWTEWRYNPYRDRRQRVRICR